MTRVLRPPGYFCTTCFSYESFGNTESIGCGRWGRAVLCHPLLLVFVLSCFSSPIPRHPHSSSHYSLPLCLRFLLLVPAIFHSSPFLYPVPYPFSLTLLLHRINFHTGYHLDDRSLFLKRKYFSHRVTPDFSISRKRSATSAW